VQKCYEHGGLTYRTGDVIGTFYSNGGEHFVGVGCADHS
jgi:hypothetical protein